MNKRFERLNAAQDQQWEELRDIFWHDFDKGTRLEVAQAILNGDYRTLSDEMLTAAKAFARAALGEVTKLGPRR